MDAPPREFHGRISEECNWREIVAWVGDLPPIPQVAAQVLQIIEDPESTAERLTSALSKDAALAARVLKIANSAMFSRQRDITTLNQAVMVIGFKALKGIIVAATLRQINKRFGTAEKQVWENSIATAFAATLIAKKLQKPFVEEIFLLGLLHSLGQIVLLAQEDTYQRFQKVILTIKEQGGTYVKAEESVLGFSHPLIGALVAKKWNFSPEICQVILHYTDNFTASTASNSIEEKIAIVSLADSIVHDAGIGSPQGYGEQQSNIKRCLAFLQFSGNSEDFIRKIREDTLEQFEDGAMFLG